MPKERSGAEVLIIQGFELASTAAIDRLKTALEGGDKETVAKATQEALLIEGYRRTSLNPEQHLEFTTDGRVLGLFDNKLTTNSRRTSHRDRCLALNLDPAKTSVHAVDCMELGLDPQKTSMHALECIRFGLDPATTSINELKKAGSNLYNK